MIEVLHAQTHGLFHALVPIIAESRSYPDFDAAFHHLKYWAILKDSQIVGYCLPRERMGLRCLGRLYISAAYRGQGIAQATLSSHLRQHQNTFWYAHTDNIASQRVAERCGLAYSGTYYYDGLYKIYSSLPDTGQKTYVDGHMVHYVIVLDLSASINIPMLAKFLEHTRNPVHIICVHVEGLRNLPAETLQQEITRKRAVGWTVYGWELAFCGNYTKTVIIPHCITKIRLHDERIKAVFLTEGPTREEWDRLYLAIPENIQPNIDNIPGIFTGAAASAKVPGVDGT